jgi:outer membrane protein assembly factor BamE (lipoprotein component of BamABCDE complex)
MMAAAASPKTLHILALAIVVAGCRHEAPERAPGLTAHALQRLRPGMSYAQVHAVLGKPVVEPPSGGSTRWLVYARPRIVSVGGDSSMLPGLSCSVVLERDAVVQMFVSDTKANRSCKCTSERCSPDWLSECTTSLPSGTPTQ